MINIEKMYLKNKITYQQPLKTKQNSQGYDYDTEKECLGLIENISVRTAEGKIIKDTYFHTNIKLPTHTKIKETGGSEVYKITDINKIATGKFGIYTYFIIKA